MIIYAAYVLRANACVYILFRKKYTALNLARQDTRTEENAITTNLKNVVPMKLSNYVYNSTDNIIVSKVLGLTLVEILIKAAICFLIPVAACIVGTCQNTEFASLKKLAAKLLKPQEGKNIWASFTHSCFFTTECLNKYIKHQMFCGCIIHLTGSGIVNQCKN